MSNKTVKKLEIGNQESIIWTRGENACQALGTPIIITTKVMPKKTYLTISNPTFTGIDPEQSYRIRLVTERTSYTGRRIYAGPLEPLACGDKVMECQCNGATECPNKCGREIKRDLQIHLEGIAKLVYDRTEYVFAEERRTAKFVVTPKITIPRGTIPRGTIPRGTIPNNTTF